MEQIGRLDPVYRDDVKEAVPVDGDILPGPAGNSEGTFIGLM